MAGSEGVGQGSAREAWSQLCDHLVIARCQLTQTPGTDYNMELLQSKGQFGPLNFIQSVGAGKI